ncbi:MAG: hypothetical protein WA957_08550 [Alteraurantiacibacter sp.]
MEDAPSVAEANDATSGWGILAWIIGAIAALGLGAFAFWWLRKREAEGFGVERIEPYRPVPASPDVQKEVPNEKVAPPKAEAAAAAGAVTATRPAPTPNPGGFVTSTVASRRIGDQAARRPQTQAQTPQQQTQRGNMTPDGRIVTSLSSMRKRLD